MVCLVSPERINFYRKLKLLDTCQKNIFAIKEACKKSNFLHILLLEKSKLKGQFLNNCTEIWLFECRSFGQNLRPQCRTTANELV